MGKWEMVRLGVHTEQIRGISYKPEDAIDKADITHLPILRAHNIQERGLNTDNLIYVNIERIKKHQYIQKGDIIVCASSGSKDLVGKAAQAEQNMSASFGAFCKVVRPSKTIEAAYLKHYFSSPFYRFTISELSAGANINNLRNEHIDDLQIPLPPLPVQQQIADVLNQASVLIEKRKAQIEKLDLLVKSRFIEMFGDGLDDTAVELRDVCTIITDGTHQPPKFTDSGIPFLLVSNIVDNEINYDTKKLISHEEYETLIKRTPIEVGDVLLTIVGSYGNPAIVKTEQEFCFQRHIAYMKPKHELINSTYLHAAFLSNAVKKQIEVKVKGIAQKTLNLSELKTIRVNLPPHELQNSFADFVRQANKSKFEMQQEQGKLELLYKSLMQKSFIGEMF